MKQRTFPYVYRCDAGHEVANTQPMSACAACVKGQPCTAQLRRIGPGSRSNPTPPSSTSPTQENPTMSTTRKSTTSKVGAVSTKPKATTKKAPAKKAAPAKAATKKAPAAKAPATTKLGMGELRPLVVKTLKASSEPLTGSAVAKQLGRSAGAVNNQLAKLVELGEAVQVSDAPRRFTLKAS